MLKELAMGGVQELAAVAVTVAAGYVSHKARQVSGYFEKIEAAHELAEENRELLAGDPEAGPPLYDRVRRIEESVYNHPQPKESKNNAD